MMYVLDTNVLSELRKSRPNAGVLAYLQAQPADSIFISALTIGEIEVGIERQRSANPTFAAELAQWLAQTELQFAAFILPVTPAIANLIRENKMHQVNSIMQTGSKRGMRIMDDSLMALVKAGIVDPREAIDRAHDKNSFIERVPGGR